MTQSQFDEKSVMLQASNQAKRTNFSVTPSDSKQSKYNSPGIAQRDQQKLNFEETFEILQKSQEQQENVSRKKRVAIPNGQHNQKKLEKAHLNADLHHFKTLLKPCSKSPSQQDSTEKRGRSLEKPVIEVPPFKEITVQSKKKHIKGIKNSQNINLNNSRQVKMNKVTIGQMANVNTSSSVTPTLGLPRGSTTQLIPTPSSQSTIAKNEHGITLPKSDSMQDLHLNSGRAQAILTSTDEFQMLSKKGRNQTHENTANFPQNILQSNTSDGNDPITSRKILISNSKVKQKISLEQDRIKNNQELDRNEQIKVDLNLNIGNKSGQLGKVASHQQRTPRDLDIFDQKKQQQQVHMSNYLKQEDQSTLELAQSVDVVPQFGVITSNNDQMFRNLNMRDQNRSSGSHSDHSQNIQAKQHLNHISFNDGTNDNVAVINREDESDTANMFQQVILDHVRMKTVVQNDVLNNQSIHPQQQLIEYQDKNPQNHQLVNLNLNNYNFNNINIDLQQDNLNNWESHRYSSQESIFNEDQKPQTKNIDRLIRSSSQVDSKYQWQPMVPSYKLLERLQDQEMKRAVSVVKGHELSGFFESDKYFMQIGFSKGGTQGSRSGLQLREEFYLGVNHVRKPFGKVKYDIIKNRQRHILKDVKPCLIQKAIKQKNGQVNKNNGMGLNIQLNGQLKHPMTGLNIPTFRQVTSHQFITNTHSYQQPFPKIMLSNPVLRKSSMVSKTDRPISNTSKFQSIDPKGVEKIESQEEKTHKNDKNMSPMKPDDLWSIENHNQYFKLANMEQANNGSAEATGSNWKQNSENNITTDYLNDYIQVQSHTGISTSNSNNYISIYDHPIANHKIINKFANNSNYHNQKIPQKLNQNDKNSHVATQQYFDTSISQNDYTNQRVQQIRSQSNSENQWKDRTNFITAVNITDQGHGQYNFNTTKNDTLCLQNSTDQMHNFRDNDKYAVQESTTEYQNNPLNAVQYQKNIQTKTNISAIADVYQAQIAAETEDEDQALQGPTIAKLPKTFDINHRKSIQTHENKLINNQASLEKQPEFGTPSSLSQSRLGGSDSKRQQQNMTQRDIRSIQNFEVLSLQNKLNYLNKIQTQQQTSYKQQEQQRMRDS